MPEVQTWHVKNEANRWEGYSMTTATLLKFPSDRVRRSIDDYRPEPAEILIAFGKRELNMREIVDAWIAFWWTGGML
jgi:hypothetical protein